MKKIPHFPKKSERGQSLVEFGISLLILLMLLTGAVETSLALFQYVTIRDAAQEGATYASINPTDTDGIRYRIMDTANDVVQLTATDITITPNGASCEGSTSGVPNSVTIMVVFQHPITYPFVSAVTGQDTITLRAIVTSTILSPIC